MSRSKKSRKPGRGSIGILKDDKKKDDKKKELVRTDKKPKKQTGNKPGNRQEEAKKNDSGQQGNTGNRDPRIGSKTPIVLGKAPATPMTKKAKVKRAPIAAIRDVNPEKELEQKLEQEIYAIEEDQQLQSILAKQEDDIALTESEVDYFNEKMERHQEIREALGWDDDEEEESAPTKAASSEDELWDKFDNSDLSEFE